MAFLYKHFNHHPMSMFKTKYKLTTILLFIVFVSLQAQNQNEWVLKNEKSGVKVYYKKTSGIYELKLITSIKSSVSGLLSLLSEVENYPKWGYKVSESKLLEQRSTHESVYYSKLDFPWPLDDRDIVMRNHVEQDPVTRKVIAKSYAEPAYIDEVPGVVRIKNASTKWTIVPGEGGWLYVEYYIYSDPGGSLPDWLINMAIDVGPRETISRIRKYVAQPQYQNKKLAHIID